MTSLFDDSHIAYLEDKVDEQDKRIAELEAGQQSAIDVALADEKQNPWKAALINEVIVDCIYTQEHECNPRKALDDAIEWNIQVALLEAENAELRVDAERYRVVRLNISPVQLAFNGFPSYGDLPDDEEIECRIDRMVDAVRQGITQQDIDAALRQRVEQKNGGEVSDVWQ